MARTRRSYFFALTSPTGKVGIFHQFGSTRPGAICVQNCIAEKYAKGTVMMGDNIVANAKGALVFNNYATASYFNTPGGFYKVEKISTQDPRYMTSNIIKEYSDFFGKKAVDSVKADEKWRSNEYKEHMNAVKVLDILLNTLGYVKKQPKNAAKK